MAYQTTLGYDPDIADYSAAIATERDAGRRAELLRQRQNKLDHLTGQGKVDPNWSSNKVVSGWTDGYRPGGWSDDTASYNAYDIGGTPYGGGQTPVYRSAPPGAASAQNLMAEMTRQAEQAAAEQRRALAFAVESGVAAMETQKKKMDEDYGDMARSAFINYMRAKQDLPGAMSAAGLSGGVSESALTALELSYQENLAQGDRERRGAQHQIDAAVSDLRAKGSIEQAQAAAEQAKQLAEALQQQVSALLEQGRWEQEFAYTAAQDSASHAEQQARQQRAQEQEQYRRQLELAKLLAASGDFSGYRGLGVDTAAMEAQWAAQTAEAAPPTKQKHASGGASASTAGADSGGAEPEPARSSVSSARWSARP